MWFTVVAWFEDIHCVAPLWCDLGFVQNIRGNKAAANLRLQEMSELWFVQVRPVTAASFKYGRTVESETKKTLYTMQAYSFFSKPFLEFCPSAPAFSCIILYVCPRIWHIKNSSASLWNPMYFKKGDLPEHFRQIVSNKYHLLYRIPSCTFALSHSAAPIHFLHCRRLAETACTQPRIGNFKTSLLCSATEW